MLAKPVRSRLPRPGLGPRGIRRVDYNQCWSGDLLRSVRDGRRSDAPARQRPRLPVHQLRRRLVREVCGAGVCGGALRQPRHRALVQARRRAVHAARHGRRRDRGARRAGRGPRPRPRRLDGRDDRPAPRDRPRGPPAVDDIRHVTDGRAGVRPEHPRSAGVPDPKAGRVARRVHRHPGRGAARVRLEAGMARRSRHPGARGRRVRPLLLSGRFCSPDACDHGRRIARRRVAHGGRPRARDARQPGLPHRSERWPPHGRAHPRCALRRDRRYGPRLPRAVWDTWIDTWVDFVHGIG